MSNTFSDPDARRPAARARRSHARAGARTSSTARASCRRSRPGSSWREFALGCFWGAERRVLADSRACTPPPSATPAAARRTRPTTRSAPGAPGTPRRCWWSSIRRRSSYAELLRVFWESHDPTQGMRQGNDVGTQYRSAHLHALDDGAAAPRRWPRARPTRQALARGRASARSPPRSPRPARSTTPRTTTSSTWPRTPAATAASAAPAWRVRGSAFMRTNPSVRMNPDPRGFPRRAGPPGLALVYRAGCGPYNAAPSVNKPLRSCHAAGPGRSAHL